MDLGPAWADGLVLGHGFNAVVPLIRIGGS
jgi:hypothetical protein